MKYIIFYPITLLTSICLDACKKFTLNSKYNNYKDIYMP